MAYDIEAVYENGRLSELEAVFRSCGISTVKTFQMDHQQYFEEDDIFDLLEERDKDGYCFHRYVETFYYDVGRDWLLYMISFTREKLARAAEDCLGERDRL